MNGGNRKQGMKLTGLLRKVVFVFSLPVLLSGIDPLHVYAEEYNDLPEQVQTGETELAKLDDFIRDELPDRRICLSDLVDRLICGDTGQILTIIKEYLKDSFSYIFRINKESVVRLTLAAILAALFSNFSNVFMSDQIAQTGFYIAYIVLITFCLHTFRLTADTVAQSLERLTEFMKVLGPVYFMGMAAAGGHFSSIAFNNIILFIIFLVEKVIATVILPLIHIFVMVRILNFLSEEEYLTKFSEMIQITAEWSMKMLVTMVTGIGLIKGLISPSIDVVNKSAVTRGIRILIMICIVPIGNMAFTALAYKGFAAFIQPVSDKRIVEAVNSIAFGHMMMVKVLFNTALLFLITIAVAAFATN